MSLILLILMFTALGYFIARSPLGDKVDQTTGGLTATSRTWTERFGDWRRARFGGVEKTDPFRTWAAGDGAEMLADEFKEWLAGLSESEAQDFNRGLADYADGLGFNLDQLVEGSLDDQPMMKQVFVETIVVYSDAFRKARKAQKEAEAKKAKDSLDPVSGNGKQPAKKRARQQQAAQEAVDTAAA